MSKTTTRMTGIGTVCGGNAAYSLLTSQLGGWGASRCNNNPDKYEAATASSQSPSDNDTGRLRLHTRSPRLSVL